MTGEEEMKCLRKLKMKLMAMDIAIEIGERITEWAFENHPEVVAKFMLETIRSKEPEYFEMMKELLGPDDGPSFPRGARGLSEAGSSVSGDVRPSRDPSPEEW